MQTNIQEIQLPPTLVNEKNSALAQIRGTIRSHPRFGRAFQAETGCGLVSTDIFFGLSSSSQGKEYAKEN